MTVAAFRDAVATACATFQASNGMQLRGTAYETDQVNPPQAMMVRRRFEFNLDETGGTTYRFSAVVYCQRVSEKATQVFLDELCEPSGLKATIETDAGVNAVVDWVWVVATNDLTPVTIGNVDYLATELEIEAVW